MKKLKKIILIILAIVLVGIIFLFFKEIKTSDSYKFSKEYDYVDENGKYVSNNFVYKNEAEIIKILEHGSGIIYLGFPECPWCKKYIRFLDEVAKEEDILISYYNISNARKNNTKFYQKLVTILSDYLHYDNNGNKKIFVPVLIAVKNGNVIGVNDETAYDTKGYSSPDLYFEDNDPEKLKDIFRKLIKDSKLNICYGDCNK